MRGRLRFRARRAGRSPRPLADRSRGWLARVLAAATMLASSGALYAVTAAPEFTLGAEAVVEGAHHTDPATVRELVGTGHNAFRVSTDDLAAPLRDLPPVLSADVRIVLPDRVIVRLEERQPILVWQAQGERFLVDAEGVVFAPAGAAARTSDGTLLTAITDRRETGARLAVGDRIDAVDLAAVRQLGAVTPGVLGSRATAVSVSIDPQDGFTLQGRPAKWRAIFGHYTPHLRRPELIPEQVRCLAALLADQQERVETVYLSPAGERCGTFTAARDDG